MQKEIKEILDRLKGQDNDYHYCLKKDISFNDNMYCSHILLDYITNLQQDYDNEAEENSKLSEWLVEKQQIIQGLEAENETLRNDFENQVEYTNKIAQENERLKENNSDMQEEMARTWQKCDDLQQENERLKEENQQEIKEANDSITWWTNRFKAVERDNRKLKQENERLKEANKELKDSSPLDEAFYNGVHKLYEDYKSKCEKAIEYNYELQERYCHSAIFDELVASKVYEITEKELNILQNGDSNEVNK